MPFNKIIPAIKRKTEELSPLASFGKRAPRTPRPSIDNFIGTGKMVKIKLKDSQITYEGQVISHGEKLYSPSLSSELKEVSGHSQDTIRFAPINKSQTISIAINEIADIEGLT